MRGMDSLDAFLKQLLSDTENGAVKWKAVRVDRGGRAVLSATYSARVKIGNRRRRVTIKGQRRTGTTTNDVTLTVGKQIVLETFQGEAADLYEHLVNGTKSADFADVERNAQNVFG